MTTSAPVIREVEIPEEVPRPSPVPIKKTEKEPLKNPAKVG